MSMNPKTVKRVAILVAAVIATATLGAGGLYYRGIQREHQNVQAREEAMAAYDRQDYPTALERFSTYASSEAGGRDVEALYRFADTRAKIPNDNGKYLLHAAQLFGRVVELDPSRDDAREQLLTLHMAVGRTVEALKTAEHLLKKNPEHVPALRTKVRVLMSQRKWDEAQEAAQLLVKTKENDFINQQLVMEVMRGKNARPEDILAHAQKLQKAHPDSAAFEFLLSIAAHNANRTDEARTWAAKAAARDLEDPVVMATLVRWLEALGLFAESASVLERATIKNPGPDVQRAWVTRLVQAHRYDEAIKVTADVNLGVGDVNLLAMRAMALHRGGKPQDAAALVKALADRGASDRRAATWAALLNAMFNEQAEDSRQYLKLCQEADQANPGSAFIALELSRTSAALGNGDRAIEYLNRARGLAPTWPEPWLETARFLLEGGRAADALVAVRNALQRGADSALAYKLHVEALSAQTNFDTAAVRAAIDQFRKTAPDDDAILPYQVAALLQEKRSAEAAELINKAVASEKPHSLETLMRLASISQHGKLNLEEKCFEAAQKAHGDTPEMAFSRAIWLIRKNPDDAQTRKDATKLLDDGCAANPNDALWRLARVRLLEGLADPRAKDEWVATGDAFPNDTRIQWAALRARSVQANRDFIGRTIDRLEKALGDTSAQLQVAKVRWRLGAESRTEKDLAEDTIRLNEVTRNFPNDIEARLLLARTFEQNRNIPGAIQQLEIVYRLRPNAHIIGLRIAALYQVERNFARARDVVIDLLKQPDLAAEERFWAAELLARGGRPDEALAVLQQLHATDKSRAVAFSLARLQQRLGNLDEAEALYASIVEPPEAAVLQNYADLLGSRGKVQQATTVLTKLQALDLPDGEFELRMADFSARYGTPEDARKYFANAVKAAPTLALAWRQYIIFELTTGTTDAAIELAGEASKNVPDDAAFKALAQQHTLVRDVLTNLPATRSLVLTMVRAPETLDPALKTLAILANAVKTKEPVADTARQIRRIADQNPRILDLQTLAIQLHATANQTNDAVELANRTAQAFPGAVEPAQLAAATLVQARRWNDVIEAAEEWKKRVATTDALGAEMAIAAAQLQLGNPDEALDRLKPHVARVMNDPDRNAGFLILYGQALLLQGKNSDVAKLYEPLLKRNASWQRVWINIAGSASATADQGAQWLRKAQPLVASDDLETNLLLGKAYCDLSMRFSQRNLGETGLKILQKVAQDPKAPARTHLFMAIQHEISGNGPAAEAGYRKAIAADPQLHTAYNNLAMRVMTTNPQEADTLIAKAIELAPQTGAYRDSHALILAHQKKYEPAVAAANEAIRLDPNNPEWRTSLAEIQLESGRAEQARQTLATLEVTIPASRIPPHIAARITKLKTTLANR